MLKDWEKKVLVFLGIDKSSTFTKTPRALCAESSTVHWRSTDDSTGSANDSKTIKKMWAASITKGKRRKVQLQLLETKGTKNLGNADPQSFIITITVNMYAEGKVKSNFGKKELIISSMWSSRMTVPNSTWTNLNSIC